MHGVESLASSSHKILRSSATDIKRESRAPAPLALRLDFPFVSFDDSLHDGQADAGAGEVGGFVEPLEWLEQVARVRRIETGTVVAHEELHATVDHRATDSDACVRDL